MIAVCFLAALASGPEPPAKRGPSFTPGAQVWLRGEGRINPDLRNGSDDADDLGQVLQRVRLQLDATWGPVRAFAQLQDTRIWGSEASPTSNEGNTDLHQGYLEVGGKGRLGDYEGYIRLGRQELILGRQRLIGNLDWAPTARAFDAIALHGRAGVVTADVFGAMIAMPGDFTVDGDAGPVEVDSSGEQLVGGQLGLAPHRAANVEVLTLVDVADAHPSDIQRRRTVVDIGGRVFGQPIDGVSYDFELHGQTGRRFGQAHGAWAWAAGLSYLHPEGRVKPGVRAGYSMASGSRCRVSRAEDPRACGAEESKDFFAFFPTNHIHYGFADQLAWNNMRDLEFGAFAVATKVRFDVSYHLLQLHDPRGRWVSAGGAPIGTGWDPDGTDRSLGQELDITAAYKPWPVLKLAPGYAVFLPIGAGQRLAGNAPMHFLYLWVVATI